MTAEATHDPEPVACTSASSGTTMSMPPINGNTLKDPCQVVPASQAPVLRPLYRLVLTPHVDGMTVFLLSGQLTR